MHLQPQTYEIWVSFSSNSISNVNKQYLVAPTSGWEQLHYTHSADSRLSYFLFEKAVPVELVMVSASAVTGAIIGDDVSDVPRTSTFATLL